MGDLLRMEGITKSYPGVLANDRIDFEVAEGEIHALLGENGAGKTTLMNILFGISRPDSGRIYWRGEAVEITSPRMAMDLGMGMVHQHFMLVPTFTVLENIILGLPFPGGPFLDLSKAAREVTRLSREYGLEVDPWADVEELPLGMKQRVEIIKALYRGGQLLILDEPTAALTLGETRELFALLRRLAEKGHSVIFISHKLHEVIALSSRVTVLRDGHRVNTMSTSDTTKESLAEMMVGRKLALSLEKEAIPPGERALAVEGLTVADTTGHPRLKNLSFQVQRGEILGIAGVDGNGQRELSEALFGLRADVAGKITVLGKEFRGAGVRRLLALKVGRIPEDRYAMGLVMDFSVEENLILESHYQPPFSRLGFISRRETDRFSRAVIATYDIRTPGPRALVKTLSGGNQQKALLARELSFDPELLILMNPTRGLDVGATEYVHQKLLERRAAGAGVLLISSDLDEILALSDRIAVLYAGEIMGIVPADRVDLTAIGLMMAGSRPTVWETG